MDSTACVARALDSLKTKAQTLHIFSCDFSGKIFTAASLYQTNKHLTRAHIYAIVNCKQTTHHFKQSEKFPWTHDSLPPS